MKLIKTATVLGSLCFLFACNDEAAAPGQSAAGQTATSTAGLPPGHPPIDQDSGMTPAAGGGTITWDLPPSWTNTAPSSSMRMAQARIPGPGGEAELAVFFFGPGGGGGVEQNLQRWADQMEGPTEAVREGFEVGGFKISTIEKSGTLQPNMMISGPTTPQPNSRLLAAVVEGEGGPWFFKATGPEATINAARAPFITMLRSIRPSGGTSI